MNPNTEDYQGRERRRFPRLRASVVEFFPIGKANSIETSFTEDISAGGICIFSPQDLEKDTLLFLKIYLPQYAAPIEAKGKVVWTKESSFLDAQNKKNYDIGVEFIEIKTTDRQNITDYVDKHPGS